MDFRKLVPIALAALICCQSFAFAGEKSDKLRPKWITHALPEPQTDSYIFVRAHGEGASLVMAKQMAFISMSQHLETERGLTVNTNVQISERFSQDQRGNGGNSYEQGITLDVTENGHQLKIVCREIDDYWQVSHGKYEVDVLYTVTNTSSYGGSYDDTIFVTAKYPGAGFMSLIPSVGQFYKGSVIKGSFILAGEIAAVSGIILCENTRASYIKKMSEQPKYAAEYNSLADSWETSRNVCIGAAAAVYVYNLIDAFTAVGAKYIVVQNGRAAISAAPYADAHSVGMGIAIKF